MVLEPRQAWAGTPRSDDRLVFAFSFCVSWFLKIVPLRHLLATPLPKLLLHLFLDMFSGPLVPFALLCPRLYAKHRELILAVFRVTETFASQWNLALLRASGLKPAADIFSLTIAVPGFWVGTLLPSPDAPWLFAASILGANLVWKDRFAQTTFVPGRPLWSKALVQVYYTLVGIVLPIAYNMHLRNKHRRRRAAPRKQMMGGPGRSGDGGLADGRGEDKSGLGGGIGITAESGAGGRARYQKTVFTPTFDPSLRRSTHGAPPQPHGAANVVKIRGADPSDLDPAARAVLADALRRAASARLQTDVRVCLRIHSGCILLRVDGWVPSSSPGEDGARWQRLDINDLLQDEEVLNALPESVRARLAQAAFATPFEVSPSDGHQALALPFERRSSGSNGGEPSSAAAAAAAGGHCVAVCLTVTAAGGAGGAGGGALLSGLAADWTPVAYVAADPDRLAVESPVWAFEAGASSLGTISFTVVLPPSVEAAPASTLLVGIEPRAAAIAAAAALNDADAELVPVPVPQVDPSAAAAAGDAATQAAPAMCTLVLLPPGVLSELEPIKPGSSEDGIVSDLCVIVGLREERAAGGASAAAGVWPDAMVRHGLEQLQDYAAYGTTPLPALLRLLKALRKDPSPSAPGHRTRTPRPSQTLPQPGPLAPQSDKARLEAAEAQARLEGNGWLYRATTITLLYGGVAWAGLGNGTYDFWSKTSPRYSQPSSALWAVNLASVGLALFLGLGLATRCLTGAGVPREVVRRRMGGRERAAAKALILLSHTLMVLEVLPHAGAQCSLPPPSLLKYFVPGIHPAFGIRFPLGIIFHLPPPDLSLAYRSLHLAVLWTAFLAFPSCRRIGLFMPLFSTVAHFLSEAIVQSFWSAWQRRVEAAAAAAAARQAEACGVGGALAGGSDDRKTR